MSAGETTTKRRGGSASTAASSCLLTPQAYDAVSRVDLMTFTERVFAEVERGHAFSPNWHLEILCAELQGVAEGRTRRQIVNVPPRSLKSISASVALVAWMLGHDPTKKIMVVSYGQELADKLARDTRQVMQSRWYKRLFPATRLSAARSAAADFETTQGGGRLATSFGGAITGRGCDLIIIDDPIKPDEALSERSRQAVNDALATTLQSRFNDQTKGAILLVMQRLHEADLCGHLLERGGWKHLNLPAIAEEDETWRLETPFGARTLTRSCGEALHPERLSLEVLDQLRCDMGPYVFAAQYQQRPSPLGGGLITLDMFGRYERSALPAAYDYTLQSWDTANKAGDLNDYSVCTTWGVQGRYAYLLAVDRRKMEYPQLKERILELRARDRPQFVLIEDGASGSMLLQELQQGCCQSNGNLSPLRRSSPKPERDYPATARHSAKAAERLSL